MWVKPQQGNARHAHTEIAQQALVQQARFGYYAFCGNCFGHILQRYMAGNGAHAQAIAYKQH